jgi:D-lyxose ketol-isomerase
MNELQAKLARRRNLNGETDGKQLVDPEKRTTSDETAASKFPTPSPQINKVTSKSDSQPVTVTSQSASNELQNKLLRRRTLNGENQSNQDDAQPLSEPQQPPLYVSRTPSQETTAVTQSASANAASISFAPDETVNLPVYAEKNVLYGELSAVNDKSDSNEDLAAVEKEIISNSHVAKQNVVSPDHYHIVEPQRVHSALQSQFQQQPEVIHQDNLYVRTDDTSVTVQPNGKAENLNSGFSSELKPTQEPASQNVGNQSNSSFEDHSGMLSSYNTLPTETEPEAEPFVTNEKTANGSIAVESKSASSELQKKLARRRDLNGEIPGQNQQTSVSAPPTTKQNNSEKPPVTSVPASLTPSKALVEQKPVDTTSIPSTGKLLSFLSKDEDENDDLDLPFISSKADQSSLQKKKPSRGIWNDETVLSNLLEDDEDPLKGFSLPANKEEVTKKLFKPKPPPSPEPVVSLPPPVSVPSVTKGSVLPQQQPQEVKEQEILPVEDEDDALFDMSLPQLPKKFATSATVPNSSSSSGSRFKSRLAMDQTKVMNSFNEFVNGIASSQGKGRKNVSFQGGNVLDMLSPTSPPASTIGEKSLLEELEGSTSTADSKTVDENSHRISSNSKSKTAQLEIQNTFVKDFLEENDRLIKELTDVDDLSILLSSSTLSKSAVSSSSSSATKKSSEEFQPPRLQKTNSKRVASLRTKALFGNSLQGTTDEDDEEEDNGGGLFEDISPLPDSTTKTSTNYTTSPSSSKQGNDDDLLLEERDSLKLVTSPDKALSLLMGSDTRQSYNPLEVVSQQALIRSYANASARRSSALNDEQVTTSKIKNRELLFSKEGADDDDEEESDEENEGEDEAKKISTKDRPKSRLFSNDKTNEDGGISLETKKVKKGQVVIDPEITYDEFIDKFKRCRDLAELTK